MRRYVLIVLCLLIPLISISKPMYTFPTQAKAQQFHALSKELRCLVCQNENIASSTAGFAHDIRQSLYQQVLAGDSSEKIKAQMVRQYGNFILFKPPLIRETWLLWLAPVLLFLIGCFIVCKVLRTYRSRE